MSILLASSIEYSISFLFPIVLKFLFLTPLEPALAGIINKNLYAFIFSFFKILSFLAQIIFQSFFLAQNYRKILYYFNIFFFIPPIINIVLN